MTSLEREFHRLDSSSDGALSWNEVREGLRERGLPCSPDTIERFFAKADTNGDGVVDAAEFRRFANARVEECRKVYRETDRDGDGRLTSGDLRAAAEQLGYEISSEQLRSMITTAAGRDQGVVSFEQFCHFLLLLPDVNPAAIFEACASRYIEGAVSEASPPPEVVGSGRNNLLAVLAFKVYSGSVAGGISRTATAPLDRLKTLMQAAPPGQASSGMLGGLRSIYREGGLGAFYRGNTANVLKIAPETSIKFVAFDQLKVLLAADKDNVTGPERFVAGGSAGAIAQAAIYPLEICKTRLSIAAAGTYSGLADCLCSIVRTEGAGALYQGLSTSVVGIVPFAGIDLSINSALKDAASRYYSSRGEAPGVSVVLACGMLSSTCAMVCTYPLNLARTRLQASGMPGSPRYIGPLDVVRHAVRAGGPFALYQGLLPNMLKVLPATSISYAIYDRMSSNS